MKKLFETTLPIVLLTPQQGRAKQWLLRQKARLLNRPLCHQSHLNPDLLFGAWLSYIADCEFCYVPAVFHTVAQRYYTRHRQISTLRLHKDKYDYCVKVSKTGTKGAVPSIMLLIKLATNEATLSFYLPSPIARYTPTT